MHKLVICILLRKKHNPYIFKRLANKCYLFVGCLYGSFKRCKLKKILENIYRERKPPLLLLGPHDWKPRIETYTIEYIRLIDSNSKEFGTNKQNGKCTLYMILYIKTFFSFILHVFSIILALVKPFIFRWSNVLFHFQKLFELWTEQIVHLDVLKSTTRWKLDGVACAVMIGEMRMRA